MNSKRAALLIIFCIVLLGSAAYEGYVAYGVERPGLRFVPPVGNAGSSASQVQQREFDELLDRLNARMKSANESKLCWEAAREWMFWPALLVTILLTFFALLSGRNPA